LSAHDKLRKYGAPFVYPRPFRAPPEVPDWSPFEPLATGAPYISVPSNYEIELVPGKYGVAAINGVATLSGGAYEFDSVTIGDGAHIVGSGPITIARWRRAAVLVLLATPSCGGLSEDPGSSSGGATAGSGGGSGSSGTKGMLPLAPFCEEYANVRCGYLVGCCDSVNLPYDLPTCVDTERASCGRRFAEARNDAALAESCLQAQQTLADCASTFADFVDCVRILGPRNREPGQTCAQHNDCSTLEGGVTSCVNGRCFFSAYTSEGASCDAPSSACEPGLGCFADGPSGPRTCQRQLPLGAPCGELAVGWCESQSCSVDTMTCVENPAARVCPGFVQ
jgi:hypothetical protein